MIRARLHHAEQTTPRLTTFWFEPEQSLRFEAGQYVELMVPHENADNRGQTRWMSLVNAPHEPLLGVLCAFPPNGSTYKRALRTLEPGGEVFFGSTLGDFALPKSSSTPLTFVIGGIGIAPVRSIIETLLKRGEERTIQLIYSVSTAEEFAYLDTIQKYPLYFMPIVTQASEQWHGAHGRLTAARTLEFMGPLDGKLIYLCGPQSLIEPLFNDLVRVHVPRAQLILDYFPGY